MVRFIYICMAILVISFVAVPVFSGVSKEHKRLEKIAQTDIQTNDSLSFKDIYALADGTKSSPEDLNNIATAAGENVAPDKFSNGFNGTNNPALEDISTNSVTKDEAL